MKLRISSGRYSTKPRTSARAFSLAAIDADGSMVEDHHRHDLVRVPSKRARPEAAIQIAIRNRLTFYGIVCVAVPNEGRRSAATGKAFKRAGLLPGFPDLIVLGGGGRVAFLEVKAPDGHVSPAQAECHAMLKRMGHNVAVVRSHDEAAETLRGWGWSC